MKKILLATTMLASVAGYAAADVAVSGDARMGVLSWDGNSTFESRVRIKFSGTGTTDGGLAFGGSFRAADAGGANDGVKGSTFISGAFGTISMGDVDSGDEAAVGQLATVGYEGLGSGNSISYVADDGFSLDDSFEIGIESNNGAKVLYTYATGAVSISASTAQLSNADSADHTAYGVGAAYSAGDLTVALGYGSSDVVVNYGPGFDGSVTDLSGSIGYVMGDTTLMAIYQDKELDSNAGVTASAVSAGASVQHKIEALTLTGFAIATKFESSLYSGDSLTANRYGLGASYDLGGGASFGAGWAHYEAVVLNGDDEIVSAGVDAFDAGVNFSF